MNLYTYTDYSVNPELLKKEFGKVNLYAEDITQADKLLSDKYKKSPFKFPCEVTLLEKTLVHTGYVNFHLNVLSKLNVFLLTKKANAA